VKNIIILTLSVLFLFACSSKSGEALIEAVKENNSEKVMKIADTRNVNATDEMGATPVMWAAYNGNVEILDHLVKKGADVRKKGIIGINTDNIPKTYTNALIAAAGEGHLEAVKYLVEKAGVHPDEKGDCLNLFILLPEDIKTTNGLIEFVKESEGKVFDYIRGHEQYKNFINSYEQARPYYFCWILGELINRKDFANKVPDSYAFRRVAENRKEVDKIFSKFINSLKGYDFIKEKNRKTALSLASFYGRAEIVSYLISKDADVNFKDCYGVSPLMSASIGRNLEIMRNLLKNKANRFVKIRLAGEEISIHSDLIPFDCNKSKTSDFKTDLKKVLPLLLQTEKDIVESNQSLLKTCRCQDTELVQIFMENGADYSKIGHNGKTLKEICKENGIEINDEWLKKKSE